MFQASAYIFKNNIKHNYQYLYNYTDKIKIFPVIKANAYGHGIIEVCNILSQSSVPGFCIAQLSEAEIIRREKLNSQLLHLGCIKYEYSEILEDKNLLLTINSLDDVMFLDQIGRSKGLLFSVHIKIDTGMTRLGIQLEHIQKLRDVIKNILERIERLEN